MQSFKLTPKQHEANRLLASPAQHIMLAGGSRSGKTFLLVRALVTRALKAPKSRHALFRFRLNHVKTSIVHDTYPKVMSLCFPQVQAPINKADLYAPFPNGSEIWFGGLDDKARTEKILGSEYATIMLNECSQIPWDSRNMVMTRLAQKVDDPVAKRLLSLKMYYDENPPDKGHWTYKLFKSGQDPDTKKPLSDPDNYRFMQLNPRDNTENLSPEYIRTLESLPLRMRKRFLEGEFRDVAPNALFPDESLDKWRHTDGQLPEMLRIVVAVDPSGADDEDNQDNDEIGILVAGLGIDGNGYVLEDLTCKAGPKTWGKVATDAYERWQANLIVGEVNFGGAMVGFVIRTARPRTPYKALTASRGKHVRAEPISALCEEGKWRLAGSFPLLEDELAGFTTHGFMGSHSPNRADAMIWAASELFPAITNAKADPRPVEIDLGDRRVGGEHGWMG